MNSDKKCTKFQGPAINRNAANAADICYLNVAKNAKMPTIISHMPTA